MADNENLSIQYTAGLQGVQATWKRRIADWSDVDAAVDAAYGSTVRVGGETFLIGVSTLPGRDWIVLKEVEIEFWDDVVGDNDANLLPTCKAGALLTMKFETLWYNIVTVDGGPAFMSHNVDSTVNMQTYPNASLEWTPGGAGSSVGRDLKPAFPVVMVQHTFTWHNIYNPPMASLYAMLGKINATAFAGHAIGTVIFNKVVATYTITARGQEKYTLTLGCTARIIHGVTSDGGPVTWNHFLRSNPGVGVSQWQAIQEKESDSLILSSAELNNLSTLFNYTHPQSNPVSPP